MSTNLINKSAVKDSTELSVAAEFYEGLNEYVIQFIQAAEKRAVANGRKTLQNKDL